jgi:hypothetical protein
VQANFSVFDCLQTSEHTAQPFWRNYNHLSMRYPILLVVLLLAATVAGQFCRASGKKILDINGREFFIKGIGIGNWLNPEGYMLGLDKVSSFRTIDTAFSELLN